MILNALGQHIEAKHGARVLPMQGPDSEHCCALMIWLSENTHTAYLSDWDVYVCSYGTNITIVARMGKLDDEYTLDLADPEVLVKLDVMLSRVRSLLV